MIRVQELLNALCGIKISTGTLHNMVCKCAEKVDPAMETVKTQVTKARVVHVDETDIRAEGKLLWVHNLSTDMYTYQIVSQKRGVEGIIKNGVLANFKGISVHDCWGPY